MNLRSLAVCLVISAAMPLQSALAGGHGGRPVSNIDELPVRSGDWSEEELAKGRKQLIAAFDAAWVRVVASGKDREVLATQPPNRPGASKSYIVRLADCLPRVEFTPWPENPVGPFKDILETGVIRQVVQGVPETPSNTSYYFSGISQGFQAAVLAEIEQHYGVELELETVVLPPGRLPATSLLVAGKVDFLSQLNATGGYTEGMRRRASRRFSCTMTASSQFIHIPEKSPLAREINNFDDLLARPQVRICAGPLATQTSSSFLPEHSITTKFVNDLSDCDAEIKEGKFDAIINPMHDLSIAGLEGYKSVHTLLVTGTPLWVADEGIECRTVGEGRAAESICTAVDPL